MGEGRQNFNKKEESKMNRNGKKIEEVLDAIAGWGELDEGYYVVNLIRDILCEHIDKEYQAREPDTNVHERYFCTNCGKDFEVPEPDFDLMNKE